MYVCVTHTHMHFTGPLKLCKCSICLLERINSLFCLSALRAFMFILSLCHLVMKTGSAMHRPLWIAAVILWWLFEENSLQRCKTSHVKWAWSKLWDANSGSDVTTCNATRAWGAGKGQDTKHAAWMNRGWTGSHSVPGPYLLMRCHMREQQLMDWG